MSAANAQQQSAKGTQAGPVSTQGEENNQKSLEKSLQKDNKRLRSDIKQMEIKIKTIQGELKKSNQVKDRLEALCRELQKQNRFIKAESSAKITEANEKGKELAQEVQSNMGFIKNINENLASITSETMQVRKENEELAKKIATLKAHYEEREQVMKTVIDETSSALQAARLELGELKLKNAQEREKLLGEMQQLSQALIQSREQMKEAKETEINLRLLLQNYDEKFNGLQKALKDTNGAYEEFKSEMSRVTNRTKELEKETQKWQARWEESTNALKLMKENHDKLQGELVGSEQSLEKMKALCRALQMERKDLLEELKQKSGEKSKELMDEVKRRSGGQQSKELHDEIKRRSEGQVTQPQGEGNGGSNVSPCQVQSEELTPLVSSPSSLNADAISQVAAVCDAKVVLEEKTSQVQAGESPSSVPSPPTIETDTVSKAAAVSNANEELEPKTSQVQTGESPSSVPSPPPSETVEVSESAAISIASEGLEEKNNQVKTKAVEVPSHLSSPPSLETIAASNAAAISNASDKGNKPSVQSTSENKENESKPRPPPGNKGKKKGKK